MPLIISACSFSLSLHIFSQLMSARQGASDIDLPLRIIPATLNMFGLFSVRVLVGAKVAVCSLPTLVCLCEQPAVISSVFNHSVYILSLVFSENPQLLSLSSSSPCSFLLPPTLSVSLLVFSSGWYTQVGEETNKHWTGGKK